MRSVLLTLAAVLALGAPLPAELEIPYLGGRVVDTADVISDSQRSAIEARLAELEQKTGAQVAVLTLPSLDGEPIEDYAIRVVESWKLGRADIDDGVLFLVVPNDRRMRIEVGYGLEPTLTDATSRRILDDIVTPQFRRGDLGAGIAAGVYAIASVAEGSELPPTAPRSRARRPSPLVFVVLLFIGLSTLIRFIRMRHDEAWTSDHGWGSRSRHRGAGPWWFGGGGFGGGGGGGFGGFSGGGGSFGGGGASGSW